MNDNWSTPTWLKRMFLDWYDSCPANPEGLRAADGLGGGWGSRTFVNPPYSNPAPWVEKAIEEAKKGKVIVLLVRVDTSTKWWLRLVEAGAHFLFCHSRLQFDDKGRPAPFASALAILAPDSP